MNKSLTFLSKHNITYEKPLSTQSGVVAYNALE